MGIGPPRLQGPSSERARFGAAPALGLGGRTAPEHGDEGGWPFGGACTVRFSGRTLQIRGSRPGSRFSFPRSRRSTDPAGRRFAPVDGSCRSTLVGDRSAAAPGPFLRTGTVSPDISRDPLLRPNSLPDTRLKFLGHTSVLPAKFQCFVSNRLFRPHGRGSVRNPGEPVVFRSLI